MTHSLPALAIAGLSLFSVTASAQTITVASFPDLDRAARSATAGFQKHHPGIQVKVVTLAYGDHHNAMTTALATGVDVPDVMAIDFSFIGKFAESGGLEDLSRPPYHGMQYQARVSRFSYPQAMNGKGGLAAMPCDIGPGALFYRKDMLDKAGISETELTRSWDSYIEAGKKIKAATGAYLLPSAVDIKDVCIRSGLQDGEGIYFDKAGRILVESQRFRRAFELARKVRRAGLDARILAWTNEWAEAYRRDRFATQCFGAWFAGHLSRWLSPDRKGRWRSAQLPEGTFASWGGSFYAIPVKARHKAEAWAFIQYLTLDKDQQLLAFREVDAYPSLLEAQRDQAELDKPIAYLGGQQARRLWKIAADKVPAIPVDKYDVVASEIVNAELEHVLTRNKDIAQALADAKAQIARRLRRPS